MNNVAAIILAAGSGSRAKLEYNKILHVFDDGEPCFLKSIIAFEKAGFSNIYLVINKNDEKEILNNLKKFQRENINIVYGGATRQESSLNALNAINEQQIKFVLIHDAARTNVTPNIINDVLKATIEYDGAICAVACVNTIANVNTNKYINSYLNRDSLVEIQTPQGFKLSLLKEAYKKQSASLSFFTDDGSIFMQNGNKIKIVDGDAKNIKLTNPSDFKKAINSKNQISRSGIGFDMHQLIKGRPLILGGVNIPYEKGLLGHSDGDSLLHAIMDALLSAANQRDIGHLFPDNDPTLLNADSSILLKKVYDIITSLGYKIENISATILAQKPKMAPHLESMELRISQILNISTDQITIGATTLEHLGFIGREEGIGVQAICLLSST